MSRFAKELLNALRSRRRSNEPDDQFVVEVDGEKWYAFAASYKVGDIAFIISFYARNEDEALQHVDAMRASMLYDGQLVSLIPNE
jgi:hypothetical protein